MLVGVSLTEIDDPGAQCGLIGEGCSVKRSGDSGMVITHPLAAGCEG